jgi:hypothetical protein
MKVHIGEISSVARFGKMHAMFWLENLKERNYRGDQIVHGCMLVILTDH